MNDKSRAHLPQHQTVLNQTLQKQLARHFALNIDSMSATMTRAIRGHEKQMRAVSAIMAGVKDREKLMHGVSAAVACAMVDREKLMRSVSAAVASPGAYNEKLVRSISAAITAGIVDREKLMRSVSAAAVRAAKYNEKLMDSVSTAAVRATEVHQYRQRQATIGFPNIIRSGLSVNPSRISTRGTPLLDPLPTALIGEVYKEISPEIIPAPSSSPELVPITRYEKVFIVHGHDHAARDTVENFVDNWGLTPIVLDEQPNKGRTIIEKFEEQAGETSFAIALLTPDDVGASKKNRSDLKPRARQNVIFELGYFFKAVGRQRVCILYKEGVELPSDVQGVALCVHG